MLDTTPSSGYIGRRLSEIQFEWDQWNVQKNEIRHGVSAMEAESCFFDVKHKIFEDLRHSTRGEKRHILYGRSIENRTLMVGFTHRGAKVRIITARTASGKEREIYEQEEETP